MIDCRAFEERLDRWIDPDPGDPDREAALRHAAGCPRCRELLAIARGELDLLGPEAGEAMARSILGSTTGPACAAVEDRLCAVVDRLAGEEEAALVALHLSHCAACSGLAGSLAPLAEDLARMAEIVPDDRFVEDVLAATSSRRSLRERLAAAASAWWTRQIRRPRFASEAAYAIVTLYVLCFGPPSVPAPEGPAGEAGANPTQTVGRILASQGIEPSAIGSVAGAVWDAAAVPAARGAERAAATCEIAWASAGNAARAAWNGDLFGAYRELVDAGRAIAERWGTDAKEAGEQEDAEPTELRPERGRTDDEPIDNGSH